MRRWHTYFHVIIISRNFHKPITIFFIKAGSNQMNLFYTNSFGSYKGIESFIYKEAKTPICIQLTIEFIRTINKII